MVLMMFHEIINGVLLPKCLCYMVVIILFHSLYVEFYITVLFMILCYTSFRPIIKNPFPGLPLVK